MRIQPVNDLYQEVKSSAPGLIEMLKEDRQQWEPVFQDIVEQTLVGGQQALDDIKSRPELPEQARETALAFLEGGLTAGCFGAITAWALRSADLGQGIAGQAEELRREMHQQGKPALQRTLAVEQERGRQLYSRSDQAEDYRGLLQEAFVAGYRIGAAEALLVLG